jgi:RNA polymerase sigma factor (TIGR02999 family)
MNDAGDDVTRLLHAIDSGQSGAADELLPLVYDELRSRAGKLLGLEWREHTLQRTELVHEAYLRLVHTELSFQSRLHFFNAAALAMRRILVDHATRRATLKRGGGRNRVDLEHVQLDDESKAPIDWLELDEALHQLEQASPRRHQIVMLRYFSGRTDGEIAEMLQISPATVRRDWSAAQIWLYRAMQEK